MGDTIYESQRVGKEVVKSLTPAARSGGRSGPIVELVVWWRHPGPWVRMAAPGAGSGRGAAGDGGRGGVGERADGDDVGDHGTRSDGEAGLDDVVGLLAAAVVGRRAHALAEVLPIVDETIHGHSLLVVLQPLSAEDAPDPLVAGRKRQFTRI